MVWKVFFGPMLALLLFSMPVLAQAIPENASAKKYSDGWECDLGYRLNGEICVSVEVPENAYATNHRYGLGWDCLRGFRREDRKTCVAVRVPDGGFLDPSGERWQCLRGFIKVDDTCQEVVVPENAYLIDATYGSDWDCERGFEKEGDLCNAIAVPINGYLNGSRHGQPWTCERGFFQKGSLCEEVVVPDFAFFDDATYGVGWKCQRGYRVHNGGCEVIDVPENAHLDRTGNHWECNRNFQNSKGLCVLNN
ncbi:hypothetical protein [Shimia sp.]|uniref:hypothetical protein n=1 Tax=Shimia sp. TaxID=1954381 RepID=UPI003BAD6260